MKTSSLAILLTSVSLLGGCASSLTGLGASDHLACKAPDGVTCSSLSGVYANAIENNLPGLQKTHPNAKKTPASVKNGLHEGSGITGEAPSSGDPIFSAPHVMRLWIAPWADAEGDLHDQSYLYVVTNGGHWEVEHHEQQIMSRYQPTFLKQPGKPAPSEQTDAQDTGATLPGSQGFVPPSGQTGQISVR